MRRMDRRIVAEAEWDAEASVWIAACPEIGLFTEADTLDELRRKIPLIASDLLVDGPSQDVNLHVELLVKFDETVTAA
jgi:Domain of unknown function (DUF1902)